MSIRCALRAQGAAVTHWQRRCAPALVALALGAPALGQPYLVGQWDEPPGGYVWPYNVINAIHLHTGDILVWDVHNPPDNPKLWNPADGSFTDVPTDADLFCAGHAGLTDGSVLVAGGGVAGTGSKETTIYDPAASMSPWTVVEPMNYARWYPTCTTLPDGRILAVAGRDEFGVHVEIPEVYNPAEDEWLEMIETSAEKLLRIYPYMFVVPDTDPLVLKVFFAGPNDAPTDHQTWTLDVNDQSWAFVDDGPFNGVEGSAVMYEPGKVLKAGGGATTNDAGDEAATIDLNDPTPVWIPQNSMAAARYEFILVLLADGTVLALGGNDDVHDPVFTTELYDPETELWSDMKDLVKERGHHSVALLLASGKVLSAGGDNQNPDGETAEIFSPPYLFDAAGEAPRPRIGFAPTTVTHGTSFSVILSRGSPVPRNEIEKVTFVRLGAVTHRFDQNQRYLSLAVQTDPAQEFGLIVEAPVNGTFAPPGYYMLFLVSDTGVPSIAKYVRLIPPPVT